MSNLINLIKWEFLLQIRINDFIKYLSIFLIFSIFIASIVNSQDNIDKFAINFLLLFYPLILIGTSNQIFRADLEDGSLELLLVTFNEFQIILAKFFAILICALTSAIVIIPIIYIILNINYIMLLTLLLCLITLLTLSSALLVLVSAMQSYFRSNNHVISILILPLLIPNIIISGLVMQNYENYSYICIMLGINILLLPIVFFLAAYLVKNIYNS